MLKLPFAAKRAILDALLTDQQAHGIVHLELPDGPLHLYRSPPNARELAVQSWNDVTPEELEESIRRANDPDSEFMTIDELLMIGDEEDQPPASPAPSEPRVGGDD